MNDDTSRKHFAAIWQQIWLNRAELALSLVATVLSAAVLLLLPERVKILVEQQLPEGNLAAIARALAIILVIVAVGFALDIVREYLTEKLSHLVTTAMRAKLYHHVVSASPFSLQQTDSGKIVSCFANDIGVLSTSMRVLLSRTLPSIMYTIVFLGAMVYYSWKLIIILIILSAPIAFIVNLFSGRLRETSNNAQSLLARLVTHLEETLRGTKEIKLLALEPRMRTGFDALNDAALAAHLEHERYDALHPFAVSMTMSLGFAALIFTSLFMIQRQWVTIGDLSAFAVCFGLVYPSLRTLSRSLGRLAQLHNVLDRIEEVMEIPSEELDGYPQHRRASAGQIRFEEVDFSYGDGKFRFSNLNLEISPGETVAVVGPSGAGKSTLLEFLPRFIEPRNGRIRIDGTDVASLPVAYLRRQIGMVYQEPFLFRGSIFENIAFGLPGASSEDVLKAAKLAHVDEFVRRFPEGYDHPVEFAGTNLSVGQRQRIAIARALLKDPPILLLDEPTSALDAGSEHLVEEAIRQGAAGRTTLIVAHRLSTVRNVDRLIFLDNGEIKEFGTHDELLALGGSYAGLVSKSQRIGRDQSVHATEGVV